MTSVPSRRQFLQSAAIAAAGVTIVPRHVLGGTGFQAPSDTLNIAGVGIGGMGRSNMLALASQNIVALCDVDWGYVDKKYAELPTQLEGARKQLTELKANPNAPPQGQGQGRALSPAARLQAVEQRVANLDALIAKAGKAKRYQDYRQMLAEQKDIDGVVVATPDHMHAAIAMAAMSLGKHVYVQKPLCWSVHEARALAKKAAETKVATQMGNQGHSMDDARKAIEYVQGGYIGEVKEVHVWTNRPYAYWPQGVPRPAAPTKKPEELGWNSSAVAERLAATMAAPNYPVPEGLAWDLFLGPAPQVPYHPIYHPFNWRGWVDWGQGALGDMGAHLIDHPFWSLELGMPTSIETVSTPFNGASYPTATMTHYEFAARGSKPAVKLTWYDGGFMPSRPEELGETKLDAGGGVLYIGSKGKLLHDTYGLNPRLLPQSLHESVGTPKQTLPRIATSHEMNWVEAAKGKTPASSPFEYAARLTETMLLGVVSLRAGTKIHYDAANMRVTNSEKANEFLRRDYDAANMRVTNSEKANEFLAAGPAPAGRFRSRVAAAGRAVGRRTFGVRRQHTMPTVDPVDFTRLAEAVSDGDAVDWAAAGSHASPSDRRVLDALKVVSEIAGLHRTMPPSAGERPAELYAGDVWSHLTLREVIGRGAYGVVYRAWDPQLDREVALKLISESSQRDQAMIVVDEGRLLAKVRHRGVVTVFGAARAGGFAGLWMELIQGATFEEIIQQQGRFSAREAALFGAEVCEALAAVHSAGLLHRDVKAQNVMRDRSGRVVLMDFGTGRVRELPDEAAVADLAGTPLYMAPELFSGGAAATQTDVYSVGVLLFRLVTGSFPLPARSLAEVRLGHEQNRAKRLRDERSDLPSAFVSIVERALSKDPARRYKSAGELELALTGFLATSADLSTGSAHGSGSHVTPASGTAPAQAAPVPARWTDRLRRAWPLAAMLALGAAAGVAGAWAWLPARPPVLPTVRFMMTPPGTEDFLSFSLAPDGSQVAFTAEGKLWTRPLGSVEARPVADSAGAHDPFWSFDSRSVAYFKQNALWVTGIGGGESRYLCPSWNAMGGSWGADGTILFAADFGRAIYRIPSTGGERVPIRLQGEHGTDLRWPSFVPGTSAFIYSSRRAPGQPRMIMVGRLDTGGSDQVLLESDANAQIAADRLLFVRNGRLFAQPFDGRALRLTGTPRPVAGRIGSNLYNREDYANFSAAGQGVTLLAYLGARQVDRQLVYVDRQGRSTPLIGPGEFRDIAMSPAGDQLAYEQLDEVAGTRDIWTLDLARRQKTRITSDPDDDLAPAWSRDSRWIYFASNRGGRSAMYRHAADGTGGDEIVMPDSGGAVPFHVSITNLLTFTRQDQRRDNDVWVVPLGPDGLPGEPRTFRASTWRENEPRFSADGKWIAYSTTDTGDRHVYIERVDAPGPRFQVSVRNGREPFWRADGKELYYHGPDRWLMAVTIDLTKPTPVIEPPRQLVQLQFRGWDVRYHVAPMPDGSGFVMNVPVPGSTPPPLSFVLNWLTP